MLLGHYAAALAAKRAAPRASLGTFVLAAQLVDGLWPVFLLLGLERVRIVPGLMAASPLEFEHYPITHSLLAGIGWAVALGLGYYLVRRYPAGAWTAAALVVSHWLLDAPMHRPDLPLWPGSPVEVGAGLWASVPATLAVELGLLAAGLAVYLRATRARDRVGSWGLGAMVGLLVLFFVSGFFSPPPPGETALAVGALGLWVFVPWAYWVDRHRELRAPGTAGETLAAGGSPTHRAAAGARVP